jgi:hypothetical protein
MSSLTTAEYERIQRSLKGWLGYVRQNHWASEFNCAAVTVLSRLFNPQDGVMDEFLSHYPIERRGHVVGKVKRTALLWMCEMVAEEEGF